MNIAKFVVLGTVDRLGVASGYDVVSSLDKKMISHWTDVKKGSIYHALKSLEKCGDIVTVAREKQGLYPTKTLYQITDKGRETFDAMQAEAFMGLFPYYFGFKIALKFNIRRSNKEIREFAQKAMDRINLEMSGRNAYLASLSPTDPRARTDGFFIEHDLMLFREEKHWISMVLDKYQED
ncbi:MAG: PadR family transcriptional regulator [Desulfovibrio sp.]|nr:MAG: PadR family transcriptional regulator [Desulfovibrio sp.]